MSATVPANMQGKVDVECANIEARRSMKLAQVKSLATCMTDSEVPFLK